MLTNLIYIEHRAGAGPYFAANMGRVICRLPWTLSLLLLLVAGAAQSRESVGHPSLSLSAAGVAQMREHLGSEPLFDAVVAQATLEVDAEIAQGIATPIPKDFSGGYTHERHKRNFLILPKAAALYQILEDETYAEFVRDMLFQYEAMYPDLPLHPQTRSYARGKLFWQCLNDANWLVYASLAYDAIYNWLSPEEREKLETNLFRPFADFLSLENPQFFNRIHNHSTWGNAAVGMIGLVMRDDTLVERALYGIESNELDFDARDDDGGYIRAPGQKAGFLANLQESFSPDGYYTEGPYYQRYAMYPFLLFSEGLSKLKPELRIFENKDGVLIKAVYALLYLSDADGEFFPLNDAQKGMSSQTEAMITAVDIAFHAGPGDPQLLDVARQQNAVTLSDAGFSVARGIHDGEVLAFEKTSVNLTDGPDGSQGGVAVLRASGEGLAAVFKYSAQGLGHGHYDKLSLSLYAGGQEVLQDYGLVRFVNIEQKGGGNYLPENTTWAKQTIAHNTLTVNQKSHFGGEYATASQHHSELAFFDTSDPDLQVVSGVEAHAYPGSTLRRTVALVSRPDSVQPYLIDLLRFSSTSDEQKQLDLPYWFMGQHLATNLDLEVVSPAAILGEGSGYEHLYLEAKGQSQGDPFQFQWLLDGRFYTLTTATSKGDEMLFVRLGANDPEFNLRRDASLILRRQAASSSVFATAIETHGSYSPVSELTVQPSASLRDVRVLHDDKNYTAVLLDSVAGEDQVFIVANGDSSKTSEHRLAVEGGAYRWKGPYLLAAMSGASKRSTE